MRRVIGSAVYLMDGKEKTCGCKFFGYAYVLVILENLMFSRLLFVSKNTDVDTDISLPEASSSGKLMFVQLEVRLSNYNRHSYLCFLHDRNWMCSCGVRLDFYFLVQNYLKPHR